MQHSLNELTLNQHLSSTPTKSRENDITKYESISLNELTPTSTNKSIQKHKSNNKDIEPSLCKKYSSIQITPKHNNNNPQYIHFNLEDLSSSSKKNSSKKRIQYASTISNFPKTTKKKDAVSPNKTANKHNKQTHNNSRSSNSQSRTHSNTINMKFITFHDINSHSSKTKIKSNKEVKKENKHNNVTTSPGKERSNTNRNRNSNKNNQQNTSKRKKKVVSINIDVVDNVCNSNSNNSNSTGIKCEKSKSSINIQKNLSHTEGNSNSNNIKDKKDKSVVESKHKNKKLKFTNTTTTTVPYLSTAPNQQPKSTSHKDKKHNNNNNNNNNIEFINSIPKPTNQKCATYFSNRKSHHAHQTHQNCLTITNSNNNFITNNKSGLNNSLINSNTTNIKHHNTISTSNKATITNTASCNNLNKKNKLSFSSSMQINTFKQKMKIKVNRKDTNNESKDVINPKSTSNSNTLTKASNKKTTLLTTTTTSITPSSNTENTSIKKQPKKQHTLTQQQLLSKGIPPKQIIQRYHKYLTHYELKELSKFNSPVYYLGEISKRKHNTYINLNKSFTYVNTKIRPITPMHSHNKSFSYSTTPSYLYTSMHPPFDDKEGDYIIKKGNQLNYRYELLCNLGKGSYGEAIKCYDHKTNEYVCIKIIKSHSKFYHQAIIEVNILEYISSHDTNSETNCVRFYTHFTFRNHICLVFELLDVNLYEYLKLNDYNGFNIKRIRSYTIEILFALLFMRKHKIIHCDLKPENILLLKNNKNNVKVIDFGSSCFDKEKLYFYIQSRFYRAPEIILELEYSMQIDMWSLGCILCELYTGQPIFPGEDERDQLNYIMEYLDVPPQEYINASRKRRVFFDNNNIPLKTPNSQGHIAVPNTKSLTNVLKGSGQHFIDFIKECLKWNPNERLTPENALMHKFIISDMNYETLYQHKIKISRMKIGMGRNVIKSAKSSLNSNRSSNYSISKQSKNEGKRNINNNNSNSNSNNNTIDKKKISVSIDKEYNKDKSKLNKIEEICVEGIQQSRSVDKKTWGFKDKEENDKEKKGNKGKGKKNGKEYNDKNNCENKMECKGNNGKVRNSLKQ